MNKATFFIALRLRIRIICPQTGTRSGGSIDEQYHIGLGRHVPLLLREVPVYTRALLARIEIGKLPLQIGDLRQIVDHDVRLVRMMHEVVLVVGLGRIKRL